MTSPSRCTRSAWWLAWSIAAASARAADVTPILELLPAAPVAAGTYGRSVALDGDLLVVGYPQDDAPAGAFLDEAGSVEVYRRVAAAWQLEQALVASDRSAFDHFGIAVAVDAASGVIAVGADLKDTGPGPLDQDNGAVYVFRHAGSAWLEEAILTNPNPAGAAGGADRYGRAVAVDGDRLLASAFKDSTAGFPGSKFGSVSFYRFETSGTPHWQYLTSKDGGALPFEHSEYGFSVALRGDVAVVGAYQADSLAPIAESTNDGTAFVYTWSGSAWIDQGQLAPSLKSAGDDFGIAVAVDEGLIAVGAWREDPAAGADAGCVSVFRYSFGGGSFAVLGETVLCASDAAADDRFGRSVALDAAAGLLAIGAISDDAPATNCGSAYLFRAAPSPGGFVETDHLVALCPGADDLLGESVAVSGAHAAASVHQRDGVATADSGAAYVYSTVGASGCAPAAWSNYGSGCPGTLGVPSLTLTGAPALGSIQSLFIGNGYGAPATTYLALGLAPAGAPVAPPPCTFLVGSLLSFDSLGLLPAAGLSRAFALPCDAALCGVSLFAQVVELEPGGAGRAFSPGLEIGLGF